MHFIIDKLKALWMVVYIWWWLVNIQWSGIIFLYNMWHHFPLSSITKYHDVYGIRMCAMVNTITFRYFEGLLLRSFVIPNRAYNLINNFSIIACGAWRARSCATAYLLMGLQHTLRAGIVRDDRELFHQIIIRFVIPNPNPKP